MIKLKTPEEIEILKEGGKKLASVLMRVGQEIKSGVSTDELNTLAHKLILEEGGTPSFLNHRPQGAHRAYPASICVSINEEIVHGIPNENSRIIQDGDLVTLDAGMIYKELLTDHAKTFIVGEVDKRIKELVTRTEEALYAAIKAAGPGRTVGDIGAAISKVAESSNLYIVEGLAGHGVGYAVHEDPYIPNYGRAGTGYKMQPGFVFAIEPMFALGTDEIVLESDGYTYSTADGSMSAQFEHTVAITEKGAEILTK